MLVILFMPFEICSVMVPDAWDVYPEEFHKMYEKLSGYVANGMDTDYLTCTFKGVHYEAKPIVEGMDLAYLTRKFKKDSGNEDVVGWMYIPKTNINYPVVQNTTDVSFYAKRNYEKFENKRKEYGFPGVIWIESNNNLKNKESFSENTIFYGHNWENYTANPKINDYRDIMFGQLASFHHFDFAKERPYIYIANEEETIPLKIIAVFYTEDEFEYYIPNPSKEEKRKIIEEALLRSRFNYNSPVYLSDKIMTFSTCTRAYGKGREDQKFVIMARPLRSDESVDDKLPEDYITIHSGHKEPTLKPRKTTKK